MGTLANKRAFVSGAEQGIGKAVAEHPIDADTSSDTPPKNRDIHTKRNSLFLFASLILSSNNNSLLFLQAIYGIRVDSP